MICFSSQPNELDDICEVPWLTVHRCSPVPNSWYVGQFQYLVYKLIHLWWVIMECHCKLLDLIWVAVQIWLHFAFAIWLSINCLAIPEKLWARIVCCSVAISSLSFKDASRSCIVLIFFFCPQTLACVTSNFTHVSFNVFCNIFVFFFCWTVCWYVSMFTLIVCDFRRWWPFWFWAFEYSLSRRLPCFGLLCLQVWWIGWKYGWYWAFFQKKRPYKDPLKTIWCCCNIL